MRQIPEKYKKKIKLDTSLDSILPIYLGVGEFNVYKPRSVRKGGWKMRMIGFTAFGEIGIEWNQARDLLIPQPSSLQVLKRKDKTYSMLLRYWWEGIRKEMRDNGGKYIDFYTTRPEGKFNPRSFAESFLQEYSMPIHSISNINLALEFIKNLRDILEATMKVVILKDPNFPSFYYSPLNNFRSYGSSKPSNFSLTNQWKYLCRILKKYINVLESGIHSI